MENFNNAYNSVKTNAYQYSRNNSLVEFWKLSKKIIGFTTTEEILEVGSGPGLTIDSQHILGIEISESAIDLATDFVRNKLICADFLTYDFKDSFDIIFDSHLFHCLEGVDQMKSYLYKSNSLLKSGGALLLELMVKSRGFSADYGFEYNDSTGILSKSGVFQRTVIESSLVEQLVQDYGFKIVYLRVDENIKFIPYSHRSESLPTDPDRMRVICLKE